MAIDDTRMNEMIGLMEEIFDNESEKDDAVGMYNVRIKDAKNTLDQWAKDNDVEPKNLLWVYDQYKKARKGKISWTKEDGEAGDLLFEVMERVNQ